MPTNIEIKARLTDRQHVESIVARMAEADPEDLDQEDTFFKTERGRLKLRVVSDTRAELIQYNRTDQTGPTSSEYTIVPVARPDELRQALANACGKRATIRKRRRVYMIGNTRVHLDTVDGLGEFLELEVVLSDGQTEEEGTATAHALMKDLDIRQQDLIDRAYVDLLEAQERTSTP